MSDPLVDRAPVDEQVAARHAQIPQDTLYAECELCGGEFSVIDPAWNLPYPCPECVPEDGKERCS